MATISWAATLSLTKPVRLVKAVVAAEEDGREAAVGVAALAAAVGVAAVVVDVAVVAVAGTVTAAIAVAVEIAAGSSLQ
jgi:hypothetical protein